MMSFLILKDAPEVECHVFSSTDTPWTIHMEPKHGDLEDDLFAFSIGWFLCSMLIFRGVQRLPACIIMISTRLNQQLRCRHCSYWTCSKAMFIDAFPPKLTMWDFSEAVPFRKGDFHRNVGFRECRRLAVEFPNRNIHVWINTKFWVVQKFYCLQNRKGVAT